MKPTKTKAEIIDIVKSNMSGGADKIVQALMDEGCIDASYVSGEMPEEKPEMSEAEMPEEEDTGDMATGESPADDYSIPKGMPMGEARGIAVKFAMKGMDKGKDKKPPFGKM